MLDFFLPRDQRAPTISFFKMEAMIALSTVFHSYPWMQQGYEGLAFDAFLSYVDWTGVWRLWADESYGMYAE